MLDKLQIFVSIIASMIVTVISIVQDVSLDTLALRLIVVIIVFYFVGLAARIYLKRHVFFKVPDESAEQEPPSTEPGESGEDMDGSAMFENFMAETPKPQRSKYD